MMGLIKDSESRREAIEANSVDAVQNAPARDLYSFGVHIKAVDEVCAVCPLAADFLVRFPVTG